MNGKKTVRDCNAILLVLISAFYFLQVIINIFIEGIASIFPPAFLFTGSALILLIMIHRKINPKITMYGLISSMYLYCYFLLQASPYLVNYLFMWLALPFSAIYQNVRVVLMAGIASILLTFYAFFFLHDKIFLNVAESDFIFFVLFGVFMCAFLLLFIQKVKETKAKLQKLAYLDSLTGAANRLLLKEKFDFLKESKAHSIALLFLDMDGFKKINDTYGHEIGDQLLVVSVSRINSVLRESDLLCRLGGDEFVILLSNIDEEILQSLSERIQVALEQPIILNNQRINVSASIGWSYTAGTSQADLELMIKESDIAMYKEKGREIKAQSVTDLLGV